MTTGGIRTATTGFVLWVLSAVGMGIFVVWSALSEEHLRRLGFTYYPNRYWAAGGPGFLVVLVYFYFSSYILHYCRNTKPLNDIHVLTDGAARGARATLGSLDDDVGSGAGESVPPISDISAAAVSRALYQAWEQ